MTVCAGTGPRGTRGDRPGATHPGGREGCSVLLLTSSTFLTAAATQARLPYDPIADFTHIASIGSAPCVVMANPAVGINTIVDLENAARKAAAAAVSGSKTTGTSHVDTERAPSLRSVRRAAKLSGARPGIARTPGPPGPRVTLRDSKRTSSPCAESSASAPRAPSSTT